MGQITPPQRAVVEIRYPRDTVTVEADELGRFRSGRCPPADEPAAAPAAGDAAAAHRGLDWLSL